MPILEKEKGLKSVTPTSTLNQKRANETPNKQKKGSNKDQSRNQQRREQEINGEINESKN